MIILDEFGGHCLTPLMLQRLCDVYPMVANVKGGHVPMHATDIHITSNYLPNQWWSEKTKFNSDAIYRRIHTVHWHYAYKKYRLFNSDVKGQLEGCAMNKFMAYYLLPPVVTANSGDL